MFVAPVVILHQVVAILLMHIGNLNCFGISAVLGSAHVNIIHPIARGRSADLSKALAATVLIIRSLRMISLYQRNTSVKALRFIED